MGSSKLSAFLFAHLHTYSYDVSCYKLLMLTCVCASASMRAGASVVTGDTISRPVLSYTSFLPPLLSYTFLFTQSLNRIV